jgi:hypothetical protein
MPRIGGRQPSREVKPLRRSSLLEERLANVQERQGNLSKAERELNSSVLVQPEVRAFKRPQAEA